MRRCVRHKWIGYTKSFGFQYECKRRRHDKCNKASFGSNEHRSKQVSLNDQTIIIIRWKKSQQKNKNKQIIFKSIDASCECRIGKSDQIRVPFGESCIQYVFWDSSHFARSMSGLIVAAALSNAERSKSSRMYDTWLHTMLTPQSVPIILRNESKKRNCSIKTTQMTSVNLERVFALTF